MWIAIGVALLSLVLSLGYLAFRCRLRGDRVETTPGPGGQVIVTSLGEFRLDRAARMVRIDCSDGHFELAFDDITQVTNQAGGREAMLSELLFGSFGITDLLPKYRDVVNTWDIGLRTARGVVPVVSLEQYEIRDFLDFLTPLLLGLLELIHLHQPGEQRARELQQEVIDRLRASGASHVGAVGAPMGKTQPAGLG